MHYQCENSRDETCLKNFQNDLWLKQLKNNELSTAWTAVFDRWNVNDKKWKKVLEQDGFITRKTPEVWHTNWLPTQKIIHIHNLNNATFFLANIHYHLHYYFTISCIFIQNIFLLVVIHISLLNGYNAICPCNINLPSTKQVTRKCKTHW